MVRTQTMLDLLDVATCDGSSLCKSLTSYRAKTSTGKTDQWYSNYSEASQRALVLEVGKLCYLVGLTPTRSEQMKGVRMTTGEEIGDEGRRVILRPRAQK